ncbi:putative ABC transporter ATP-binding protein YlmA [Zhongshania aliphaticivorans]|uniref:Putative ABC transporter ATP-binding protein YlmA n=1 Tax=Zhongshania aliphaticivorans TaxID=1470434 RepID=A0A5S9NPP2_9GAMM|nr:ATP-binding cassette domain-containing protein [Zhongshania aliphaticivorans]CAA0092414.1 putative ABC transporter ATP-binding protein YlmA [Zhongshania aliphaticivorans]CAA0109694.1 putative ABC transporter ATP-binding protein YlmA [Zhongshania aliphaticivorans]
MSAPIVRFQHIRFSYQLEPILDDFSWFWPHGQHIAILGGNGAGKTTLAKLITDTLRPNSGEVEYADDIGPKDIAHISFDLHRELMEHDRRYDDSETRDDAFDVGTTVKQAVLQGYTPDAAFTELCTRLGIDHILEQGIRYISTGESRKTLLARALFAKPAALILDNPFEGLDIHAQAEMHTLLAELVSSTTPLILLTKDANDIPDTIDTVYQMDHGKIRGECSALEAKKHAKVIHHFAKPLPIANAPSYPADKALLELRNINVNFRGKQVLSDINWTLMPHQHCCISGPNGAGKSTLLGLLCGENDKAYGQQVFLFGRQRGSGESIWEVKSQFGILNTSMQMSNLKRTKAIDVVASGLFDSVGLYNNYSESQRQTLMAWLDALDLLPLKEQRFERLSFGEQRMILLARAMVKSPRILILDEPCIGLDNDQKAKLLGAVDQIAAHGQTRILFVSHRREELPACINQFIDLVPSENGGYTANIRES